MLYWKLLLYTIPLLIVLISQVTPAFSFAPRKAQVLFVDDDYSVNKNWIKLKKTEQDSLKALIKMLVRSSVGKKIVQMAQKKAQKHGFLLTDIIESGRVSMCDTSLVRRFSASEPVTVVYETHFKIYIDSGHKVVDAVLDLAHELTHFILRGTFNPYVNDFTLTSFIASTIEGAGGEIDAYINECRVGDELFPKEMHEHSKCMKIKNQYTNKYSRQKAFDTFYSVGEYLGRFKKLFDEMGGENLQSVPQINGDGPYFISSAYGVPYPLASILEYTNIMKKACKNDLSRLDLLKRYYDRNISSIKEEQGTKTFQEIEKSFEQRCQKFIGS